VTVACSNVGRAIRLTEHVAQENPLAVRWAGWHAECAGNDNLD